MAARSKDPYETLGVSTNASDAEIRKAYRQLVVRHHPDHNNGSAESTRRFEEVQEAYARIRTLRAAGSASRPPGSAEARRSTPPPRAAKPSSSEPLDPDLEARLADLERQLREAEQARERARQAAREAAAQSMPKRPTDEELGYIKTDDSFSKIFDDALSELSGRLTEVRKTPVHERVSDLIGELDELASKLTRRQRPQ
jgi:curved DNA-binding protein CbpA